MRNSAYFIAGILIGVVGLLLGFLLSVWLLSTVGINVDLSCYRIDELNAMCGMAFEKINSQGAIFR